jgi:3,4-dihydroxy 2-butanone 4-phosphate synthase / GTP cyclohydrolase II
MPVSSIEEVLEDIRAGKMIILVDDEDRENEGDLYMAAELVTPEAINFMAKFGRGLICLTLTAEHLDRLELPMMVQQNRSPFETAFTVSIEARTGVTTGISAADRARTIQVAVNPEAKPTDLVSPGRIFPLRAKPGGVLVRTGQTEGSVDLMKLAGLRPAAVIIEICREDGEMARRPELEQFARRHNFKICSVEQIIQHRLERERLIRRMDPPEGVLIETDHGPFTLYAFESVVDPLPHIALTVGGIGALDPTGHVVEHNEPVLVRMHRRNLLGDIFGDRTQPTNRTLAASLRAIQDEGRGALVYLRPSGVGEGLLGRLYEIGGWASSPSRERSTDSRSQLGEGPNLTDPRGVGARAVPMDQREFGIGGQILRDLGLRRLRILTNNPKRLHGLSAFGLEVEEFVSVAAE